MPTEVKTRAYNSPRRRAQAEATRRAILAAATRLFLERGYGATTIADIAREAEVALKTVYVAFDNKAGVLRALWNLELRGERDDVPIAQQEWYLKVLAEPDPERQLRLNARKSREGKTRISPVLEIIRGAAPLEPEIAELWERIQGDYRENQRAIVASLAKRKTLRRGLSVERGADILWALNNPDVWQLLVGRRGWTPAQYERWAADSACAQLLESRG
jgi:AcrR family transcriptional regulator